MPKDPADPTATAGRPLPCSLRGPALLGHPFYNKGTAFSREERTTFALEGLLPDHVSTMEQQVERVYGHITRKTDPLEQYIGLAGLQDRNEHLFYRLLSEHIEALAPIVYTPTVGLATQRYSHIFRRARGIWLTPDQRGRIEEVLQNAPCGDVRLIVVTDNERILGLGDQGAGGMGIPIGKLALYTVAAGIHPQQTLPISLDVGTDNPDLLEDELYLGWRQPRLRGERYDALIAEFVEAVKRCFPRALLQWEDFKKANAIRLLERYRRKILSFNDDIQGTAAVALAGILAGVRATGVPLVSHRVVILGAGAAGLGIAHQVGDAFRRAGVPSEEITSRLAILDSRGLLVEGRSLRPGEEYKQELAWPAALAEAHGLSAVEGSDLESVVRAFKPTVLVGTSGQPGTFTEEIVRAMAEHVERPLIFPFSNPTSKSEAVPADLIAWTAGRALVATGSPFEPVTHGGRTHRIGQGNNVYIFPGVGLGTLVAEAREVTHGMFTAAAETLAAHVTDADLAAGALFPRLTELRRVTARIAEAAVREARDAGVAPAVDDEAISARVAAAMWSPVYPVLEPA
jgi:malic enzyme